MLPTYIYICPFLVDVVVVAIVKKCEIHFGMKIVVWIVTTFEDVKRETRNIFLIFTTHKKKLNKKNAQDERDREWESETIKSLFSLLKWIEQKKRLASQKSVIAWFYLFIFY